MQFIWIRISLSHRYTSEHNAHAQLKIVHLLGGGGDCVHMSPFCGVNCVTNSRADQILWAKVHAQ